MCEYIFWGYHTWQETGAEYERGLSVGERGEQDGCTAPFHEIFPYALQRRWDLIHLNVMLVGWEDCRSISRLVSVRRT